MVGTEEIANKEGADFGSQGHELKEDHGTAGGVLDFLET
jgi:hypothetical protein